MTIATGVAKLVAFKKEASFNVSPTSWTAAVTGAQYLRRVTSDIDIQKDTYSSNEIRSDYQVADVRTGTRKVGGTLKGELSPGAYSAFMGSLFRKDFAAIAADTAINTVTIATAAGSTYTLTRGTAGYLAKNWKAGVVAQITAQTGGTASNMNKNLFIVDVTDTVMTVIPGGDGTLVTGAPTSVTLTHNGKYSYTPETGHTNDSYAIEHYYSDLTVGEVFSGCRIASMDIALPATGIATIDIGVLGVDVNGGGTWPATSQYFSSPTAASAYGILTAVAGKLRIAGSSIATITGLSMKIDGGMTTGATVGSNVTPDVFAGRVVVTGQFTAYFDSITLRNLFLNETSFELLCVLYADGSNAADYISFAMYKCKALGAAKSDGEQGLILTVPFQALLNTTPATNTTDDTLRTTLMVSDSKA